MSVDPEAIVIEEYDPAWVGAYAEEAQLLQQVFASTNAIVEHVGSTAVEGLGAKPTIDIMVGLESVDELGDLMDGLAELGYLYLPEYEQDVPERRFFRKPGSGFRRYHLHCVPLGGEFYREHLLFRDYLRSNADVAASYLQLKQALAKRLMHDRAAYMHGKTDFIQSALAQARTSASCL